MYIINVHILNTKKFYEKKLFLSFLLFSLLWSCSNEFETTLEPSIDDEVEVGRFDTTPFAWDIKTNNSPDDIFIGDVLVKPNTPLSRSSYNDDSFLIGDAPGVYVGAPYPKTSILNGFFDQEISKYRNPIDIIFDFSSPYIDEITRETGSIGYKLALRDAIRSSDYVYHLKGGTSHNTSYSMVQFGSYSDIEKGFSNNTKFGSAFSAKVKINTSSKKIKVEGRLFARLENVNFSTYMDRPAKGLFKTSADNETHKNDAYIKAVSYGRVSYIAIESSYSYEKVKTALDVKIKAGLWGSSSTTAEKDTTTILSQSSVTLFVIGDRSKGTYFEDGVENLAEIFTPSYDEYFYGLPIFIKAREIGTDKAITYNVDNTMTTEMIPLYRYWNQSKHDHIFSPTHYQNGFDGWLPEGITCYLPKTKSSKTTTLYEYWDGSDHYYTTAGTNPPSNIQQWKYSGIVGEIYINREEGTVPLYGFWNSSRGWDHLITTERNPVESNNGWAYERVWGYVYP